MGHDDSALKKSGTQLARKQEELRISEMRYRRLFETAKDGILILDAATGAITDVNPFLLEMLGYSLGECVGKRLWELGPFKNTEVSQAAFRELQRKEYIRYEDLPLQACDGRLIDVEFVSNAYPVDGKRVIQCNIRDITRRKRAEQARTRLALAVEHTAESVVISETDGEILYVNHAFENITGYRREEVLGQNPRLLNNGKQSSEFYQAMWATLKQGKTWTGIFVNKRKDGTLYEAEAVISPVRDEAGRIINYVGVERDVTRERQLEEQLRQSQKMEAIGQLAGGIAHDFNNLLTIITGYGQLLFDDFEPDDPRRLKMREINKAAARAVSLTRQLLAFGRRQVLASEVLDLNDVLTNLEKMLHRLIREDIELVIVQGEALGRVRTDRGQIEQVIMNLVLNARDAMPQEGKLTLETSNVHLDEACSARNPEVTPGPYVMLAVRDTGCGISPEAQTHIFEPFFTTKEKGKGTGLGLSTVYGIVRQCEGCVCVESEPGKGTAFKICLPRVKEQVDLPDRTEEGAATALRGSETILLVEDEEAVRLLVRDLLEGLEYKVLVATRGDEAIAICKQYPEPIPLLLTDVVMPGMSGRELADHLKFLYPGMKLLYMSGYTEDAMLRRSILGPGAAFLGKPFTPQTIARKVREVLDHTNDQEEK